MKFKHIAIILILLIFQTAFVCAITPEEAKQDWKDAKIKSLDARLEYREIEREFKTNQTEENRAKLIQKGKDSLNAALDEGEAWLIYKKLEVEGNENIPDNLKQTIISDADKNLATIDTLRKDVDNVKTQLDLGIVFLKIVGKYTELLTDVARNSGLVLVHVGNTHLDTANAYEVKLREHAQNIENNTEIIKKLDEAKSDLDEAKTNVDKAESSYKEVVTPGKPLIKFAEGNNYMRVAKTNLLSAQANMVKALDLILKEEQ